MKLFKTTSIAAVALASVSLVQAAAPPLPKEVTKIAFGSCNKANVEQPLWPVIESTNPDLWIWMGDNIYADFKDFNDLKSLKPPFTIFSNAQPSKIQAIYEKQLSVPTYKRFTEKVPMIGIWDDHDYGRNDGGKWFPYKEASQQLFLNFIGEPEDSPRRKQKGIYTSYTFGSGNKKAKIILLDTRYNRDYYKNRDGDFLGTRQWEWLDKELRTSDAAVNIIVSGIQVLPTDKLFGESWNKFEKRRQQLLDLVADTGAKGVTFLSGDVHYAEINEVKCNSTRLTEITSSGMTHSWGTAAWAPFFWVADYILPWPYRPQWDKHFAMLNFGELVIHWDTVSGSQSVPEITTRIYGIDGEAYVDYRFLPGTFPAGSILPETACQPARGTPNILENFLRIMAFAAICTVPAAAVIIFTVWFLFSSFFFIRDTLLGSSQQGKEKEE